MRIDGNDVEAVYACVEDAAARARAGGGPAFIEAMTYRLWGHMMGDPESYRTKEEVAQARLVEPIVRLGQRLRQLGQAEAGLARLDAEAAGIVAQALQFAEASPEPSVAAAAEDVFI